MKTIIFYCAITCVITIAVDLPSNFKTCKRSDPNISECLRNAVKEAVIFLANGLKSLKITPLEPLEFKMKINETQGPISLKQEYRNNKIYGLTKKFKLHDFQIDWDNSVMKFYFFHENINFTSDYKVEGKILLLPVFGSGKCNISAYDITTHHEVYYETFEKGGESYIRVKKYFLKISIKHLVVYFGNLFNGNEVLGKEFNHFLNENVLSFFKELQPFYEEALAKVLLKISTGIFTQVPMNKIFPLA